MKQMDDVDYIEHYAKKLKKDNRHFKHQKEFIESQLQSSSTLFKNMFAGKDFKKEARKYLKSVGLL